MMNKKNLELYVHIPFCVRKCDYCDFLSFPGSERMQREYVEKLLEEIEYRSARAEEYQVVSVFIGGGTPSILQAEEIASILQSLRKCFDFSSDAEITMEMNPGTVTEEGLLVCREAGVNRISIGLQSADDKELRYLGRIHTYDEFLKSYQRVRMAGFDNVNVDLISAIPGQTLESWKNTLKRVVMLKPEHISAYSLIVEEGTPFYDRYGNSAGENSPASKKGGRINRLSDLPDLPGEDAEREMYYFTQSFLLDQGYERYEISNYSKKDRQCRHNTGYWTGVQYMGLGLGSSSYIDGCRFHNTSDYREYCSARLDRGEEAEKVFHQEFERLTIEARMEEYMFLGLRLTRGVSARDFAGSFGQNIRDVYGPVLDAMMKQELMELEDDFYRLTSRGIDISNYVMSQFLI